MKFYTIPDNIQTEIAELDTLIKKFQAGKMTKDELKVHRVPFGVYEQREDDTFMVRIRCSAGGVTPRQLKRVAEIAHEKCAKFVHITTRMELQIHNVDLNDVIPIIKELVKVDLCPRGGGGNTVRNVMASPDSGIYPNEVFDVSPYAIALSSRLISEPDSWKLPRKFKITFVNHIENNNANVHIHDVGYIAEIRNGVKGFKVYVAGGMGGKPAIGNLLHEFIEAEKIYLVAEALKQLFYKNGNRKNKYAARLRFLWKELGAEKFVEMYQAEYDVLAKEPDALLAEVTDWVSDRTLEPKLTPEEVATDDYFLWKKRYVYPQKQEGFAAVKVPLHLGNIPTADTIKLSEFLQQFGEDTIRMTMDQNFYLRNIPESHLGNLYNFLKSIDTISELSPFLGNAIACTGADTCKLGICLPKGLLTAIKDRFDKTELELDKLGDFKLNISGCPNTCGQHNSADLGFFGKVARNGQDMMPAYNIVAGADGSVANPSLAKKMDSINSRDLPNFLHDFVGQYLSKQESYESFTKYIDTDGKEDIKTIVKKYKKTPTFEQDKNYYFDWSAREIFSLKDKGQGECSAGIFDTIEFDINNAKALFKEIDDEKIVVDRKENLYQALISIARALLVTRGAEAKSDKEVFDLFEENFVNANLVSQDHVELLNIGRQNGDDIVVAEPKIRQFLETIVDLYKSMDNSLMFKVDREATSTSHKQASTSTVVEDTIVEKDTTSELGNKPTQVKDFRGVACPMNFVKTKIALAPMALEETLEIYLDDGEPIDNVPGSVRSEGHEIVEQKKIDNYWSVLIRKKA